MNKIEHIGIAVTNLEASSSLYEKLLNTTVYKIEDVPSEGVKTAFLQNGPNKVELLEATGDDSAIAKFIAKKGEGIHHIAFEVDDIRAEMARLKSEGFRFVERRAKVRGRIINWFVLCIRKVRAGYLWNCARRFSILKLFILLIPHVPINC